MLGPFPCLPDQASPKEESQLSLCLKGSQPLAMSMCLTLHGHEQRPEAADEQLLGQAQDTLKGGIMKISISSSTKLGPQYWPGLHCHCPFADREALCHHPCHSILVYLLALFFHLYYLFSLLVRFETRPTSQKLCP